MVDSLKKLATAIEGRAKLHAGRAANVLHAELGTVTAQGIKLDRFNDPITNYLILDGWDLTEDFFTTTELGEKVNTPAQLKPLKVGDRVLLIPVNNGQDFVVTGRVKNG